ncbi:class I SAM-dependent methyltransferase [Candidatus Methylomirabilis sp.]|uniref:class I SAM-dependent methyltransferase n=1 Tax=Candidatus Methylomirabilis sp. TaxID=2032687 RepID=UPI002A648ABB|nr:class I SAM-dependent methyltransferase [Candidatus Methylomirabilis sp.]
MPSYLETHYTRDEYSETAYPQRLCDHIVSHYIRPHVGNVEQKTILDVGSGKGNHLVGFARRGLIALGLDKRKECLKVLDTFDIRECDLERDPFPFETESLDIVFSKSVIEHVANADNFLKETYRILKPGGLAILMTPDWRTQAHLFWDDYTHVKPWTRKGLQNALIIHGFEEVESILFRQLPLLWKYPVLEWLADAIALVPESWKWKDCDESAFREWIRFSKEKMLLATAVKPAG